MNHHEHFRWKNVWPPSEATRLRSLDFPKLPAFDQPDELVPLGMGQPNRVLPLADSDTSVGDLDFGTLKAKWA